MEILDRNSRCRSCTAPYRFEHKASARSRSARQPAAQAVEFGGECGLSWVFLGRDVDDDPWLSQPTSVEASYYTLRKPGGKTVTGGKVFLLRRFLIGINCRSLLIVDLLI